MPTLTSTLSRPTSLVETTISRPVAPAPTTDVPPRTRKLAVTLLAGGLAAFAVAAGSLSWPRGQDDAEPSAPVVAAAPGAITLAGPGDVSVVSQLYEPGQASGWHSHAGIHAVAILSGALTVYDGQCRAEVFAPGRPYIGGQELHLARNETRQPVEMVVTYISPSAPGHSTVQAAPPACALSTATS